VTDPDLAALQGVWRQVGLEADGVVDPPDMEGAEGALTTFAGETFTVRTPDGHVVLAGSFILDATTTPRSVTWIDSMGPDAGKQLPASYVLDSDRLLFIAANEGDPRPTVFRTGPGQTMRTFVRVR